MNDPRTNLGDTSDAINIAVLNIKWKEDTPILRGNWIMERLRINPRNSHHTRSVRPLEFDFSDGVEDMISKTQAINVAAFSIERTEDAPYLERNWIDYLTLRV